MLGRCDKVPPHQAANLQTGKNKQIINRHKDYLMYVAEIYATLQIAMILRFDGPVPKVTQHY